MSGKNSKRNNFLNDIKLARIFDKTKCEIDWENTFSALYAVVRPWRENMFSLPTLGDLTMLEERMHVTLHLPQEQPRRIRCLSWKKEARFEHTRDARISAGASMSSVISDVSNDAGRVTSPPRVSEPEDDASLSDTEPESHLAPVSPCCLRLQSHMMFALQAASSCTEGTLRRDQCV